MEEVLFQTLLTIIGHMNKIERFFYFVGEFSIIEKLKKNHFK